MGGGGVLLREGADVGGGSCGGEEDDQEMCRKLIRRKADLHRNRHAAHDHRVPSLSDGKRARLQLCILNRTLIRAQTEGKTNGTKVAEVQRMGVRLHRVKDKAGE
jgi:hypothetical protein